MMTTIQSSQNTTAVIQGSNSQPSTQNLNTTIVEAPGNYQYTTQPFQNPSGIIFQGGPQQMQAASMVIQGTPQTVNTAPIMTQGTSQTVNTTPMMMMQRAYPQTTASTTTARVFPVRTLKVFGGVQIGLGVLLCILSLVGTIFDSVEMADAKQYCQDWHTGTHYICYRPHTMHNLFVFDVTCLILSGWFILTGFLPMCMSRKRQNSWRCLKISFMVCSIIGASVFVPTVFSLGVVGSLVRAFGHSTFKTTVISVFIALLSFAEVVIAIVSASYCCCCTNWNTNVPDQQGYMYLGGPDPHLVMVSPSQIPETNMQPVIMTGRQQQYVVSQQQEQNPYNGNMLQDGTSNVTINPPPYKE